MKDAIKNITNQQLIKDFNLFIKQCYPIAWSVGKTECKNQRVVKKNVVKPMLLSNFAVCDSKKIETYQRARS